MISRAFRQAGQLAVPVAAALTLRPTVSSVWCRGVRVVGDVVLVAGGVALLVGAYIINTGSR